MAAPYLIVLCAGDSNAGNGQNYDASVDLTDSNVFQLRQDMTTVEVAPAQLANVSMTAGDVGSTQPLCRLLSQRGKIPTGYNILIVPVAVAGTAFLNQWATTGSRTCLDGNGSSIAGLYPMLAAALALDSRNRLWFIDWNHGENDGGQTQTQYQNNMIATFGEIRDTYNLAHGFTAGVPTAKRIPILVTGCPPDRQDPLIGAQVNMGGPIAAQQNIANVLESAVYVDPTGLHSYFGNGFVHFSAASHRGGVDNSTTSGFAWAAGTTYGAQGVGTSVVVMGSDGWCYSSKVAGNIGNDPTTDGGVHWTKTSYQTGQLVSNPLSERKYAALMAAGWKMQATF